MPKSSYTTIQLSLQIPILWALSSNSLGDNTVLGNPAFWSENVFFISK